MAIIIGGNGNQTINGTNQGDIIIAGNGNDTVNGGNGNDIITGGNGNDVLNGGAGNDIIIGGNGNDTLDGGAGNDIVTGGNGNDVLDGGSGSDILAAGGGNDTLIYRASENVGSVDIYDGGDGKDTLRLIVTQAMANSAAFVADIAALQAKLAHGSASYMFKSFGLTVTSIEVLQIVIDGGTTNHVPVAVADTVSATEDVTLTILASTLLANDTDPDSGDTKTLVSVQSAQHGAVSLNSSGNVAFTADANYSGVASFTYTMKDSAGATSTATVTVNVAAVADAPTLTVAPATGNEDTQIALSIGTALTDTDGSEHIASLVVSGIPAGAVLTDGTHTFTGDATHTSIDVSGWTLSALKIKPPANSDVDFNLTVTSTSQEGTSGPTASTTATLAVTVNPVADAPTLAVTPVTGNEDTAIGLTIGTALTDTDGSEHIASLVVSTIPVGATLTDGAGHSFTAATGSTSVNINGWTLSGLKITPPANSDVDFNLTVTSTSQEGTSGPTASTSATLAVTVNPVADAPTLTVTPATGNEDTAIGLSIATALTDTDGSEHIASVVVSAIPTGATLSDGAGHSFTAVAGSTSVNINGWALSGLKITPPANSDVDFNLTVTSTSQDGASGPTASTTATLAVTVNPVADMPTLSVSNATGNEDTPIALNIASALTDTDGSEHLSLVVSGIPAGATLSDGAGHSFTAGATTSVDVASWSVSHLTVTPPSNSDVDFTLTVTATSLEGASGPTASTSATLNVVVNPVSDAPVIATSSASGAATDASIPLSVQITLSDLSETLGQTVSLSGIPSAFALNHGSVSEDGIWTVSLTDLGTLALIPASGGKGIAGDFTITIVATSQDGVAALAPATGHLAVSVANPANALTGTVNDGYVSGATVFADHNHNGVLDTGEVSTTTAADGTFTLIGADPNDTLVMAGGTDISTGLAFLGQMSAPGGSTVVTPLTTLVSSLIDAGQTAAQAETHVKSALGISSTVDLTNFDAVAATINGNQDGASVLAAAIQVQTTIAQISTVADPTKDVSAALASALASGTPVDLTSSAVVNTVATSSGVSSDALATVSQVVADANQSVASAVGANTDPTVILAGLSQAATVALGATATALANTDFTDTAQVNSLHDNFTGDALATQVAAAPVAIISLPILGTIGNDNLTGTPGDDAIDGQDGDDVISGGAGNDQIYGGAGRDLLSGDSGNDLLDGGTGFDRAVYSGATGPISVQLAAGIVTGDASVGTDTLHSIEGIVGTAYDDTFDATGFTATSTNGGGLGIVLSTGNGAIGAINEFEGGDGNDTITGNGNTRVSYQHAAAAVTVDLGNHIAYSTAGNNAATIGVDILNGVIGQVRGSAFDDTLVGTNNGNTYAETFEGLGGNDFIDGKGGFDRVRYDNQNTGASGITINLGAGTVTGLDAAATAVVGMDTLRSVESVRGTNAVDVFDASTFTANSTNENGGDEGTFNEFEGMGGNDSVIGNGNTRISYANATGPVSIVASSYTAPVAGFGGGASGTASGDSSVGTDTFSGVNTFIGSAFNDTITGSNNGTANAETFIGWNGDDQIFGNGGFDRVRYDVNSTSTSGILLTAGISVNMATGDVNGLDSYAQFVFGHDTLRGIEAVRGTIANDTYTAVGMTGIASGIATSTTANVSETGVNAGGAGFNEFEGMGGDDIVTGNGNTRISYSTAISGVTVTLTAATAVSTGVTGGGTGTSDGADTGHDTFSGVSAVIGSALADTISAAGFTATVGFNLNAGAGNDIVTGSTANDTITGGAGNDTIDGGLGIDLAEFSGVRANYSIAGGGVAGSSTVTDTVGTDGVDGLTNIELMEFTNAYVMNESAFNFSTFNLTAGKQIIGTNNNNSGVGDNLTLGSNANGRLIDLGGGGTDTLTLATGGSYSLNLANVESLIGSGGNDIVTLQNVAGLLTSINLGAGSDTLNLASGGNTVTLSNVETVHGGVGNDVVTLNTSGATTVNSIESITGSSGNDAVTIQADAGVTTVNDTIDLGAGTNSVALNFFGAGTVANLALTNVNSVTSSGGVGTINLANAANGMTVDTGATGIVTVNLGNGDNTVEVHNAFVVNSAGTHNDNVTAYLQAGTVNQSYNLGSGTDTLTLAGSSSDMNISVTGSNLTVIGATTAVNEHINLLNVQVSQTTFDLGAGTDDSLTLYTDFVSPGLVNNVVVKNIETVNGSNNNDIITIANTAGTTTVTGGYGSDNMTASAGIDQFHYTSIADSQYSLGGPHDIITNFDANQDTFVFSAALGFHPDPMTNAPITFVGTSGFDGGGVSEARLDMSGAQPMLQIDVDGDGQMNANDIVIELHNLTNTLHSSNFLLG